MLLNFLGEKPMKVTEDFVFFHGKKDIFSQWHNSAFTDKDIFFKTAEHFMMFQKCVFFEHKDKSVDAIKQIVTDGLAKYQETSIHSRNLLVRILEASTPKDAKALGKEVKFFNKQKWEAIVAKVLLRGNMLKFQQNPELLTQFLSFKTQRFVEASPFDRIYGIGLADSHPNASNPSYWRGQNILGDVLTQLRDYFLKALFPNVFWFCPSCQAETMSNNEAIWSGKNLQCCSCKKYHYYSGIKPNHETLNDRR